MSALTQNDLMAMPLEVLAGMATWTPYPIGVRLKAWEALHARLPELDGTVWSGSFDKYDRDLIKAALALDLAAEGFAKPVSLTEALSKLGYHPKPQRWAFA